MPRIRHHVNPHHLSYLNTSAEPAPVPAEGEVEVELGCADARFLFERATEAPEIFCVGVEIRRELVRMVNTFADEQGVRNLLALFANINQDLDLLFADGRLARVFINFPDPWFKRRHRKRRMLTPEVAGILRRKLARGGELFFQSDVFELALDAMAVLEDSDGLRNLRGPWSFAPDNPHGARSLREMRSEERGQRIWRLRYLRA